jgi:chaperonin GroES
MVNIKVINDNVLIEREELIEKTPGGLLLPVDSLQKPSIGKVLSVSDGILLQSGDHSPWKIKNGDRVLYKNYTGEEFKIGAEIFFIIKMGDIIGVIE